MGSYKLDRLLGSGGMGQVWLAHDTRTGRDVALKVLPPHLSDDSEYRRRFLHEAAVAAGLHEPHVVPIHSWGELDGQLYIDMAYIGGRDLATILTNGPLPPSVSLDVITQAADALDAAHESGLIHRDVKPSNLFLTDRRGFVYLIDFGIAHAADQTRFTSTGVAVGTLEYMAPERFEGSFDARADVYSLACVLFQCLTGEPPFGRSGAVQQMHGHINLPPPSARLINPAVPPALDAVIARGMAKQPDERFDTAGEFAAAARHAVGAVPTILRTPTRQHEGSPVSGARSSSVPVVAYGVVALLAALTGAEMADVYLPRYLSFLAVLFVMIAACSTVWLVARRTRDYRRFAIVFTVASAVFAAITGAEILDVYLMRWLAMLVSGVFAVACILFVGVVVARSADRPAAVMTRQ